MPDEPPQPRRRLPPSPQSQGAQRAARLERVRQAARERIHAWAVHPIDTPRLMPDPLEHHRRSPLRSTLATLRLFAVAVLLHGLIIAVFFAANHIVGERPHDPMVERVEVRIVEPEPEPEPEPPPPPEEVEEPEAPVVDAPPPKPKPREKPPEPPPDPVTPPPEPPSSEEAPPRRVVGLDLGSTVAGGSGPAFATGSTRMGRTASRADDPEKAARAPAQEHNQAATRLPVGNRVVVRPRRLKTPEPVYPPLLRQQGIEADVVVVVTIDSEGRVSDVRVIRPAPEAAFNKAAVRAARQSVWAPATRGGEPFETTQRYTIRFRLND